MSSAERQDEMGRDLAANGVAKALAVSCLVHFIVIAGMEAGHGLGLWEATLLEGMSSIPETVEEIAEERRKRQEEQIPMIFVQIDPSQAVPAPPRESKFYSSHNTAASNPDPNEDGDIPEIDGSQEVVPEILEAARPAALAPEPARSAQPKREVMRPAFEPEPQPEPEPEPLPEPEPRPARQEGEMEFARVIPRPRPVEPRPQPSSQRDRPRTLKEARARSGIPAGPKLRQRGGVRRAELQSNLDVTATPFGSYDAAFIAAVRLRWFNLLDENLYIPPQSGRVVLDFRLNQDGRITEMRVVESEVSETLAWLCQRAIIDPSPYAPFPRDLRRQMNKDFREVRFTFHYH